MKELELIIKDYIEKMKRDYNVIGAMLTGSYVTGNMDLILILIFFLFGTEKMKV